MSVQTSYRLYQNNKGVGVIGENNPYDIGAFITGNVTASPIGWGVFVIRSTPGSIKIVTPNGSASVIIGATTKQEDRVEGQYGGINKDTSSNSNLLFTLSEGRPASVMRMGYLNMPTAIDAWNAGDPVYVKVIKGTTGDDGHLLGTISTGTKPVTSGTYEKLATAIFVDSSESSISQNVAKVFFDTRIPVATIAAAAPEALNIEPVIAVVSPKAPIDTKGAAAAASSSVRPK